MKSTLKLMIASGLVVLMGSCTSYHTRKGNEYYNYMNYASSIEHLQKAYKKNQDAQIELRLADAYFRTSKLNEAEQFYKNAVQRSSAVTITNFDYGKVLMSNGKHAEARDQFRKYLAARISKGGISKVVIERTLKRITITIHTARPGIVIGKGGQEVDKIKEELKKLTGKDDVQINILEIRRPELDATIVGDTIARQIENRIHYLYVDTHELPLRLIVMYLTHYEKI